MSPEAPGEAGTDSRRLQQPIVTEVRRIHREHAGDKDSVWVEIYWQGKPFLEGWLVEDDPFAATWPEADADAGSRNCRSVVVTLPNEERT